MSANSDARFGIINQQQHLAFNHHPRHLAPPPLRHYHRQQPLPLTAAIDRLQPQHTTNNRTTNGDVATPRHKPCSTSWTTKAYLGRYILCCIYQLADRFPRKDVSKF